MLKFLLHRHRLTLRVLPWVAGVIIVKFAVHAAGIEFLSLNALFTGIVSADVFLMGFLISGVLSDYKESERIPTEMSASLEALHDEATVAVANARAGSAELMAEVTALPAAVIAWFARQERTVVLLGRLKALNVRFAALEGAVQPNFIARMKQEQSSLRRLIIRTDYIRDTNFISSGYAIAEAITSLLIFGLVFVKLDPFRESLFFVSVIAFLMTYMIMLIRDLANPFGYGDVESAENVSLKPLRDLAERSK
jgi:hypothetical protein